MSRPARCEAASVSGKRRGDLVESLDYTKSKGVLLNYPLVSYFPDTNALKFTPKCHILDSNWVALRGRVYVLARSRLFS